MRAESSTRFRFTQARPARDERRTGHDATARVSGSRSDVKLGVALEDARLGRLWGATAGRRSRRAVPGADAGSPRGCRLWGVGADHRMLRRPASSRGHRGRDAARSPAKSLRRSPRSATSPATRSRRRRPGWHLPATRSRRPPGAVDRDVGRHRIRRKPRNCTWGHAAGRSDGGSEPSRRYRGSHGERRAAASSRQDRPPQLVIARTTESSDWPPHPMRGSGQR